MELTTGKKSNQELAEWFGITTSRFNHAKEQKIKELEYFAEFHYEGKKVVIDKVLEPVYSKQMSERFKKVHDKVDETWSANGLDSAKHVGEKIATILKEEENLPIAVGTAIVYTRQTRNELYGKPFMGGGKLGGCSYVWCKRDENGNYNFLTPQEEQMKQDLMKKYFGDTSEKQILVKGMIEAGEITQEEAWGVLEELTNMRTGQFMTFLGELSEKVGCQIVRGTYVERNAISMNDVL